MTAAQKFGMVAATAAGAAIGAELFIGIVAGIVGGFAGFGIFVAGWIALDEVNGLLKDHYRQSK